MLLSALKHSFIILFLFGSSANAQNIFTPSDSLHKTRAIGLGIGQGVTYASTLGALQLAWYREYQTSSFHFFNDWPGWQQMDKVGHAATAYQISNNLYKLTRWAGIKENRSIWYAAGLGYSYQLVVELMDGFSSGWGFSNYDLLFNTVGTGLFTGQQLGWDEQRIKIKYSFWPSGLTNLSGAEGRRARNLYGEGLHKQWLKDYNGQTYWVNANIWSLIGKPDRFPKWLAISTGYSANNLLGAESNTWSDPDNEKVLITSSRSRQRQLLFSLDIDLDHVDLPRSLKWMKPLFGFVKVPFPALELNSEKGLRGHLFYF
jgi:hypothetical protein